MEHFLASQLKHYRMQEHLTQKELAQKLYVTDKAVSKWETGRGYPDLATLEKISALLGITIDDLVNERKPLEYFEVKSEKRIKSLPLYHFVLPNIPFLFQKKMKGKTKVFSELPTAKGFFSIGIKSKGIISIGIFSMGILSVGAISLGLISMGMLAFGLLAAGNAGFGGLAMGNFAIGITAVGNLAVAMAAFGNFSIGYFALGNHSLGAHAFSAGTEVTLEKFSEAVQQFQLSHSYTGLSKFFFETLYKMQSNPLPVILGFLFIVVLLLLTIGVLFRIFRQNGHLSLQ